MKLPNPNVFDMGSHVHNNEEIILFGGFVDGQATSQVSIFKPEEYVFNDSTDVFFQMASADHFPVDGLVIKNPKNRDHLLFAGHSHIHLLKTTEKTFYTLK